MRGHCRDLLGHPFLQACRRLNRHMPAVAQNVHQQFSLIRVGDRQPQAAIG